MKRTVVSLVSIGLLALAWGTAEAGTSVAAGRGEGARASTVTITFRIDLDGSTPASRRCRLEVPSGSNGIAVLRAAVEQGCITSYEMSDSRYPPPGPWSGWEPSPKGRHWLRCIDAICDAHAAPGTGVPGTRWVVTWNAGSSQRYWDGGLEGYAASRGDAFSPALRGFS